MWSRVIGIAFSESTFYWIRLAHVLKNIIDTKKYITKIVLLRSFSNISLSTACFGKPLSCVSTTRRFFLHCSFFFFMFESIYLKYLKSLQSGKKLSLASLKICDHMFSDPDLDHTFHVFWLHTWIVFCFF